MQQLWLIYWAFLLISFMFGIYLVVKKHVIWGLIQALLSFVYPIFAFAFALRRNYLSGVSELSFLFSQLRQGSLEAILVLVGFIAILFCNLYSIVIVKKDHRQLHS